MENLSHFMIPGFLFLIAILLFLIFFRIGTIIKTIKYSHEKRSTDLNAINENMAKTLNEFILSLKSLENTSQNGVEKIIYTLNEVTKID